MAHGYLSKKLEGKLKVYSAGTESHGLNPYAVLVMRMDGVDISDNTSNLIDDYMHIKFDFIITVCDNANEACPYIPATPVVLRIHKNFEDPSKLKISNEKEKIEKYIYCRNQIKDFCIEFIANNF
tara:strand:+ start:1439 stop:1813 length:375 start_codon:yes stop_codon:yes gene_type:complete